MPKKILVVCQHYWPETFRLTDLCEGFVERGYEVDVLCGIPNYPAGKFFSGYGLFRKRRQSHNGVNIIRVPEIPRGNNSSLRILLNYLSYPFFAIFYIPYLATKRYDRIFVYQLSPVLMALPGILLAKLARKKIFIYILDFWPHSFFSVVDVRGRFSRKLLTKVSYWHYRQTNGVIGAFKGIQERLVEDVGIDKNKTLYIPQAAEKIYEQQIHDQELGKRFGDKFNIVFAGNINPAQSFGTILDATKLLKKRGCTGIRFIILGEGMSKKWLLGEIQKYDLTDYFVFEGLVPVEEVPRYQTIADALIVALSRSPLFEYGIPAKVQSYMASGKPIVAAMDGSGQELINDRAKCGICVDSGDSEGVYNAIIKLLSMKKQERILLGERGRRYHLRHFERNYNLNRFIEFIINDNPIVDKEFTD